MDKSKTGLLAAGLCILLSACGSDSSTDSDFANAAAVNTLDEWNDSAFRCAQRSIDWSDVNDWHYQLQKVDYEELASSQYDLLVVDSEPSIRPNQNVIDRLKCMDSNEKLLVSYLAIGQAEDYRYYYQDNWRVGSPDWIVYPDPNWLGDFYVRYWDPEWRAILMGTPQSRIDRVIDAGFDGVYLDAIDAYTYFEDENPNALSDMQTLVSDIAQYARTKSGNPDFGVFVQNGEDLVSLVGPEWLEPLTGVGKVEPFYRATDDRVPEGSRYWNDLYLDQWVAAGKLVLSVDYVSTQENRTDAIDDAHSRGYVPLMLSSHALDRMDQFPDHLPD